MADSWRKVLWAVEFRGALNDTKPMMLGFAWHELSRHRGYYHEEPSRALLFRTREAARRWCTAEHAKNRDRTDCCAQWRFRPVRVIETVRKV